MKYIENSRNYFVSEDGDIYRGERKLNGNVNNYLKVRIWYKDGLYKDHFVHRLVATAYVDNPHGKPIVNHIDGNKFNNHPSNLEWVTAKENSQHAVSIGLIKTGFEHQNAVLTEESVISICEDFQQGYRVCDIVKKYKISQPLASNIFTKTKYSEISKNYVFPKRRRKFSDETIHWVCKMLQSGKRLKEIQSMSSNKNIDKGLIDNLLQRKAYTDISKDYRF